MSDHRGTYVYEHTDGSTHPKPALVVEMGGGPHQYFDSSFVRKWWFEEGGRGPTGRWAATGGGQ